METPADPTGGRGMDGGRAEVRWAPRVSKAKVRRLYESEARGMLDEDLLDEVGVGLMLRCQSILDVHEAKRGRVRCPRCARGGRETVIEREFGREYSDTVACPVCDWSIAWPEYVKTFKRRQLNPGGAVRAFRSYAEGYPRARSPRERMLLVDRLIHEFHFSSRGEPGTQVGPRRTPRPGGSRTYRPGRPTRAVGVNLIKGKLDDVIAFLDGLSAGPEERKRTKRDWRERLGRTHWGEGRETGSTDG